MFPDMQVLFMMVLPLKASWIAVAEAGIYIYSFITGGLIEKIEIVLSLILMGVFFGWMKKLHKKIYTRSHKDFTKNP